MWNAPGKKPRKKINTNLDENQAELGVLVLAVALQVTTHVHCLLDHVVQILRDGRGKT